MDETVFVKSISIRDPTYKVYDVKLKRSNESLYVRFCYIQNVSYSATLRHILLIA